MLFKRFLCSDFEEIAERFFVAEDTFVLTSYQMSVQERRFLLDISHPYITTLDLSAAGFP